MPVAGTSEAINAMSAFIESHTVVPTTREIPIAYEITTGEYSPTHCALFNEFNKKSVFCLLLFGGPSTSLSS